MAILKCTFPHDGYAFGQYVFDVSEAEAEAKLQPDSLRIQKWMRVPDEELAQSEEPKLEAPVAEVKAEEPKLEEPKLEEPKLEEPKPSKKK